MPKLSLQWGESAFWMQLLPAGAARRRWQRLPTVVQINAGAQIAFRAPGVGEVIDRLTVLNLLDRVNLIRPAEGIGIFQSAYGPRLTVLNPLTISF